MASEPRRRCSTSHGVKKCKYKQELICRFLTKLSIMLACDSAVVAPGVHATVLKAYVCTKVCPWRFSSSVHNCQTWKRLRRVGEGTFMPWGVIRWQKTRKNLTCVLLRYGFPSKNWNPTIGFQLSDLLERRHRAGMSSSNMDAWCGEAVPWAAVGVDPWHRAFVKAHGAHNIQALLTRTCGSWFLSCNKCTALTQDVSKRGNPGAALKFVQ